MPHLTHRFDRGLVTARDRAELNPGELQRAAGIWYPPGDGRATRIGGRSLFDTVVAGQRIRGIKVLDWADGTVRILASGDTGVQIATTTDGLTGAFLAAAKSFGATGGIYAAKYNDKWFLVTGRSRNAVVESDGTFRDMGMIAPQQAPQMMVLTTDPVTVRPETLAGGGIVTNTGWVNVDRASDPTVNSFASATLKAVGTSTITYKHTLKTKGLGRMFIRWQLAGWQIPTGDSARSGGKIRFGPGRAQPKESGFRVRVKIEKLVSVTAPPLSTNYVPTVLLDEIYTKATDGWQEVQSSYYGSYEATQLRYRITLQYLDGTSAATLRIGDLRLNNNQAGNGVDATALYYCYTEYDAVHGIESPPGPVSEAVSLIAASNHRAVQGTIDSKDLQNPTLTTHRRIYRTPDNGVVPGQLGLVATIAVTPEPEASFVDDFALYGVSDQPLPIVPLKAVRFLDGEELYPRDTPPPRLDAIAEYEGHLIGLAGESMWWSEPDLPESWPETNFIKLRSRAIAAQVTGDLLIVARADGVEVFRGVLNSIDGALQVPERRDLAGEPGCVSAAAMTVYSVGGRERVCWVSPIGIRETDGLSARSITDGIVDWDALLDPADLGTAVLEYDPARRCLVFAYDGNGDGANDSYLLIHVHDDFPYRITGPTPGTFASLASGKVDGTYRFYSGDEDDGGVYVENRGTGRPAVELTTGRVYGKDRILYAIDKGLLRHYAPAALDSTVTLIHGRDQGNESSVVKTVRLNGQKGTEFFVGRAAEWTEMEVSVTGEGECSFLDAQLRIRAMGQAGTVL